jgi:hypothetical protein
VRHSLAVVASEREVRAAARALRGILVHSHPMVRRAVTEAIDGLPFNDLFRFTERCEAVLLRQGDPINARVHATDSRD